MENLKSHGILFLFHFPALECRESVGHEKLRKSNVPSKNKRQKDQKLKTQQTSQKTGFNSSGKKKKR